MDREATPSVNGLFAQPPRSRPRPRASSVSGAPIHRLRLDSKSQFKISIRPLVNHHQHSQEEEEEQEQEEAKKESRRNGTLPTDAAVAIRHNDHGDDSATSDAQWPPRQQTQIPFSHPTPSIEIIKQTEKKKKRNPRAKTLRDGLVRRGNSVHCSDGHSTPFRCL